MAKAPTIPALPTTHGWRMYMITPSMVKVVGVKTPASVPKVFLLMVLTFIAIIDFSMLVLAYKKMFLYNFDAIELR